jgi:hypothetical protein
MPCIGKARVGHKAPDFTCEGVLAGAFYGMYHVRVHVLLAYGLRILSPAIPEKQTMADSTLHSSCF